METTGVIFGAGYTPDKEIINLCFSWEVIIEDITENIEEKFKKNFNEELPHFLQQIISKSTGE